MPTGTIRIVVAQLVLGLAACGGGGSDGGNGPPPPPPPPAPVRHVIISPANDTLAVRQQIQLTVTLEDSAGNVLTDRTVSWASLDSTSGTVTAAGILRPLKVGSVTVQATSEGQTGSATFTLAPILRITRRYPSLFSGDTTLLAAVATDVYGNTIPNPFALTWSSRTPTVATVAGGQVTAAAPGTAQIVVASHGGSDSVVVLSLLPRIRTNREIGFLRTVSRSFDSLPIEEVWTINSDGSGLKRVTPRDQTISEFSWSPDGSRLVAAFVNHNGYGLNGIYVLNADGSGQVRVGQGSAPRWSPDGNRIAYRSSVPRVVVVNADGSGSLVLTPNSFALDPDWSPDGRKIAYRVQNTFCDQLWVIGADGTDNHRIQIPTGMCNVRWSPDGKQLAFASPASPPPQTGGVWVINEDGSGLAPASSNCSSQGICAGGSFWGPEWSPDGSALVFGNQDSIYTTDRWGGSRTAFQVLGRSGYPRWSPDGTLLVFQGVETNGPPYPAIGIVSPNGTGGVLITSGYQAVGGQWRPGP